MNKSGWTIKSPCGRGYHVSREVVVQDYVDFIVQADGLSKEDALVYAEKHCDPDVWFREQFDWQDVMWLGRCVGHASPEDISKALDFVRANSGYSPSDCVVEPS